MDKARLPSYLGATAISSLQVRGSCGPKPELHYSTGLGVIFVSLE
jgi:hypothetical protein